MKSNQTTPESSIITRIFVTVAAAMIVGVGAWVGKSTMSNTIELINNTNAVEKNVILLENLTESVDRNTIAIRINTDSITRNSETIRAVDGKVNELKEKNNLK